MTKMTVTRGLAELKTLDARINTAISQGVFVAAVPGAQKLPIGVAKSAEQLTSDINASYQTVRDLIKRREAIKRAIIVSNGKTEVVIGGQKMTVAEAIERKTSINYLNGFHAHMAMQLQNTTNVVNTQNARVDADIEKRVMAAYGNEKGKVSEDQHKIIADAVKKESAAELLDPKKINDQIATVRKEFEDFSMEVDFVLSESNARTEIEIAV